MLVIRDAWRAPDAPRGAVLTIGNYDGIHLGQQAILRRVRERAQQTGRPAVVVTFEPHPLGVLDPPRAPRRLTTPEQKAELLAAAGMDALLILDFTRELAGLSAERFVREFLSRRLGVAELFVGTRFGFGRHREGDLGLLQRLGAEVGFVAHGVPELLDSGEPVSSTRVRQALAEGRVGEAARLLGRPYAVEGVVIEGARRGQRLGWPTLNLNLRNEIAPADGVYISRVRIGALDELLPGVTNVGHRPTVQERGDRLVECHVLDFDRSVYGEEVHVDFLERIREERRFASVDELVRQIGRDVRRAREYFEGENC